MKFSSDFLLKQEEILDIHFSDVSYSPLFSTLGLCASDDACGIDTLMFHYNRENRALFAPFLKLSGMRRVPSSLEQLCFSGEAGDAAIAFYDRDRMVLSVNCGSGQPAAQIFGAVADDVSTHWTVSVSADTMIVRGYSKNSDARDPDASVPFMLGVRVLRGTLTETDGMATLCADGSGQLYAAIAFDALVISADAIRSALQSAPEQYTQACALSRAWFVSMLNDFSVTVPGEREAQILSHALKGLLFNATVGQGELEGYVSAYPSRGTYPTHFLWDSCFQNLALEYLNPRLARDSMLLFAQNIRADGKFPQFLCSTWGRPHETQPALIGWASMRLIDAGLADDAFLARMYEALSRNNRWWLSQRMTRFGVLVCPHGLETGQDDSPRFDGGPVLAVDMNSYLYSQLCAVRRMAELLGRTEEAADWQAEAGALAAAMVDVLYDPETNFFYDADPVTGKRLPLISGSGFLPLWAGIDIGQSRAHDMITTYLLDPTRFWGRVPLPCIAYDQPQYRQDGWWRGPTWMSLAWLLVEMLEHYGFAEEYRHVCRVFRDMITSDGNLRELFDSQTGAGLGAFDQGWTAAVYVKLCKLCEGFDA